MTDPITKSITVPCAPAQAFDIFVNRIAIWWPLESHATSAADGKAALGLTIEPRVGGAVTETRHDGSEADWGRVLQFVQGELLEITWHPGDNADNETRVLVEFSAADAGTDVRLTHSGWEIWGDAAAERRENYNNGWDTVLGVCFAKACADVEA